MSDKKAFRNETVRTLATINQITTFLNMLPPGLVPQEFHRRVSRLARRVTALEAAYYCCGHRYCDLHNRLVNIDNDYLEVKNDA